jgi:glycosyltransferase involved in cell wall biosynthesis
MSRVVYEFAAASAQVHAVSLLRPGNVFAMKGPSEDATGSVEIPCLDIGVIPLPDLRSHPWGLLQNWLENFAPEIIHAQDFGPLSLLIQDWAWRNNVPFVLTLHCLPSHSQAFGSQDLVSIFDRVTGNRVSLAYVTRFIKQCDGIIALNQSVTDDLLHLGYKGPIFRVSNGRRLAMFQELQVADESLPIKQLVFIGSFARRKNQRFLIEMLVHLQTPVQLALWGEILESGYLQTCTELVHELGLEHRVHLGYIPFEEIPGQLSRAHLFVSASTLEVQSLAIIEALASGTPVVGLANQTLDELVDDSCGRCLAAAASPVDFAREVDAVLKMTADDYRLLCVGARKRVMHLDWANVVHEVTLVYQDLCGRKQSGRLPPARPHLEWTPPLVVVSRMVWLGHSLLHPKQNTNHSDSG